MIGAHMDTQVFAVTLGWWRDARARAFVLAIVGAGSCAHGRPPAAAKSATPTGPGQEMTSSREHGDGVDKRDQCPGDTADEDSYTEESGCPEIGDSATRMRSGAADALVKDASPSDAQEPSPQPCRQECAHTRACQAHDRRTPAGGPTEEQRDRVERSADACRREAQICEQGCMARHKKER